MEVRPDAADRSVESVPVPRGASPEERPAVPDTALIGPDAQEISGLLAARLPVSVHRERLLEHPQDLLPQAAALEARPVSEPSLPEPLPDEPRSDAR